MPVAWNGYWMSRRSIEHAFEVEWYFFKIDQQSRGELRLQNDENSSAERE